MQLLHTLCNVHLAMNNTINLMSQSPTPCIFSLRSYTTFLHPSTFANKLCAKSFLVLMQNGYMSVAGASWHLVSMIARLTGANNSVVLILLP